MGDPVLHFKKKGASYKLDLSRMIAVIGFFVIYVLALLYWAVKKTNYHLPVLPVLTPHNRLVYPEWHSYYERVYKHSVVDNVDLNTFTFFFWDSPLGHVKVRVAMWQFSRLRCGQAWVGDHGPELLLARVGFFVHREACEVSASDPVEVIRVNTDYLQHSPEFAEKDLAWFFGVKGSGMFIKRPDRGIVVLRTKYQVHKLWGVQWPHSKHTLSWEQNVLPEVLESRGIRMLIISHSGYPAPRVEVIVPRSGKIGTCGRETLFRQTASLEYVECVCDEAQPILNCDTDIILLDYPPSISPVSWRRIHERSRLISKWQSV